MLDEVFGRALHYDLDMDVRARHRRGVLASMKFVAWAIFPVVFVLVAVSGVGLSLTPHARSAFDTLHIPLAVWLDQHLFRPLMVAAAVALATTLLYSTAIKMWWNRLDQPSKYARLH